MSFFPAEEEEELKKSAVVNWYLSEIESEIDSEEELINRKSLIEKVLNRLVHYVSTAAQFAGPQHGGPRHVGSPPLGLQQACPHNAGPHLAGPHHAGLHTFLPQNRHTIILY